MKHARRRVTPAGNPPKLRQRLVQYARLARLHRPIGIALLLWPMLWALWIAAGGVPSSKVLVIFVLGTVVMRSAGCVINDYADRNFDGRVERTRDRPLPSGTATPREALLLFTVLLAIVGAFAEMTRPHYFVPVSIAVVYGGFWARGVVYSGARRQRQDPTACVSV